MSIAAIQNEILGLSAEERAKLIDLLWDSLSEPDIKARETAWAAEAERRIDAFLCDIGLEFLFHGAYPAYTYTWVNPTMRNLVA